MDEQDVEFLIRKLFAGKEKDLNDFITQFNDDYNVPDETVDEIMSRQDKLTPNDIMTLLRFAGRDFEYINDPEPDDNKYMEYIQDALRCNKLQRMMKELKHD